MTWGRTSTSRSEARLLRTVGGRRRDKTRPYLNGLPDCEPTGDQLYDRFDGVENYVIDCDEVFGFSGVDNNTGQVSGHVSGTLRPLDGTLSYGASSQFGGLSRSRGLPLFGFLWVLRGAALTTGNRRSKTVGGRIRSFVPRGGTNRRKIGSPGRWEIGRRSLVPWGANDSSRERNVSRSPNPRRVAVILLV